MKRNKLQSSHLARLLEQVLTVDGFGPRALSLMLGISVMQLEQYRAGEMRMPFEEQNMLVEVVLAHLPQYSRAAHTVAAQASAEAAYRSNATTTHANRPSRFGK